MRISVFTRKERERKKEKKTISFFSAVFNLVLDQIQFRSGDLTHFCDEAVQKTRVLLTTRS